MGKPTGFLEYLRKMPTDIAPGKRIQDWQEFHNQLCSQELAQQGARCMDCGTPYCHTGTLLAGMVSGCPINNLIPEWNELIYHGHWQEALARLQKTNNFPEFTGRVCPAPCEGSCTVALNDDAVTIKNIECAIVDRGFAEGWIVPRPPSFRTGKQIAVVGSGPAGLACADQLNKAGHQVTVIERADRIGGLLMYGIPNMKLDKKRIQRRVDILTAEGIQFVTGTEVGKDYPMDQLLASYDAIVLCAGATKPRDLLVPGRELKGIHFAVDFLQSSTKSLLDSSTTDHEHMSASKRDVVVIGGGDTGTDCVGTSIRQGCQSIVQFEIMSQLAPERVVDNPWPQWPMIHRVDYGQEEAIALYGRDPREYAIMTKRFDGDDQGWVRAVHTVKICWERDTNGRLVPQEIPGTEQVWPTQFVLLAMGFLGPETTLVEQIGLTQDARSNVKAVHGSHGTNVDKLFVAGDMRRGQSLVVWAIEEGRAAAKECDRYLMGESYLT